MISRTELKQLSAPQRAELIYSQARSELSDRLWRAALGTGDAASAGNVRNGDSNGMRLEALLSLFERGSADQAAPTASPAVLFRETPAPSEPAPADPEPATPPISSGTGAGLGSNARHLPALTSAAERTGIPVPALAAIINAEAAKGSDGSWKLYSRNPRSSAAGLGQFLSGTWEGMAERPGTWLNRVAREKGWLNGSGQLVSQARPALLSLRYDATASINTVADFARSNLDGLRRAGVAIGEGAENIARSAYLGHHLGLGDAIRFMKSGLPPARARMLLGAQVGIAKASAQIAQVGDATAAHRSWFLNYVNRNVRAERFTV